MVYADYDFYANTYFGRAIAEADFPRFALRGSQYMDYLTQGRSETRAELEAVKLCCCELAEQYQMIDTAQALARKSLSAGVADGLEVQSEAVGSWSKSYRSGGDSAQSAAQVAAEKNAALYAIAQRYLSRTGLLSRAGGCWR